MKEFLNEIYEFESTLKFLPNSSNYSSSNNEIQSKKINLFGLITRSTIEYIK